MTCVDYNFIKSFDLTRFIHDEKNSIESIFNVLQSSLNEKQIRGIIDGGIKNYFKKCDDFTFVNNIHKHVVSMNNTINHNKSQSTSTIKSYCGKVFEIVEILAAIYSIFCKTNQKINVRLCV